MERLLFSLRAMVAPNHGDASRGLARRSPTLEPAPAYPPTTWLSGEIITALNKLVLPVPLLGIAGILTFAALRDGHNAVAGEFRWLAAIIIIATVWMLWFSSRLCRVGYAGRELVISNYRREARVPFDRIAAVDSVWWYQRRLVRIELPPDAGLGPVIYYIPKWALFRAPWSSPEKELRELMS